MGRTRERLSGVVAEALAASGARAVVGTGWGGVSGEGLPDHALATPFVRL